MPQNKSELFIPDDTSEQPLDNLNIVNAPTGIGQRIAQLCARIIGRTPDTTTMTAIKHNTAVIHDLARSAAYNEGLPSGHALKLEGISAQLAAHVLTRETINARLLSGELTPADFPPDQPVDLRSLFEAPEEADRLRKAGRPE